MSEIEAALKDEEAPFHISNEERLMLVEVLGCIASVLKAKKLTFETKSGPANSYYADFCLEMAKRFANMPVEQEQ